MHRTNDTHDEQLIDLGSVVEETRGGMQGEADGILNQRQTGISGIFDD